MINISTPKNVHIIGICGVGMSATALLLRDAGWHVTGSDSAAVFPPVTTFLEEAGIEFARGFDPKNIPDNVDLFVIGKTANLRADLNAEVAAANTMGKPIVGYPDVMAALAHNQHRVVVAGSYGKSTTTAILSHVLKFNGLNPSYFFGAFPLDWERHAELHTKENGIFVLEGDEYPSSHTDPRAKFMHYTPQDVILTSATPDHPEIYPTPSDFRKPFANLLAGLPADGKLVVCADNEYAQDLIQETNAEVVTYGLHDNAMYQAQEIHLNDPSTFALTKNGKFLTTITTPMLGAHNIQNIVGVAALCIERGWLTPQQIADAIASFHGIRRRLINLTVGCKIPVLEAFGSTDQKLSAALQAVRAHYPSRRVILVFEPSTFGWRNRPTSHWYSAEAFGEADDIIVTWLSSFDAADDQRLGHTEITERIRKASTGNVQAVDTAEAVLQWLKTECHGNEVILLSSSRTLMGLTESVPAWVKQSFAQATKAA